MKQPRFKIGQRVGYKKRSLTLGYMFMVGEVVSIQVTITSGGQWMAKCI